MVAHDALHRVGGGAADPLIRVCERLEEERAPFAVDHEVGGDGRGVEEGKDAERVLVELRPVVDAPAILREGVGEGGGVADVGEDRLVSQQRSAGRTVGVRVPDQLRIERDCPLLNLRHADKGAPKGELERRRGRPAERHPAAVRDQLERALRAAGVLDRGLLCWGGRLGRVALDHLEHSVHVGERALLVQRVRPKFEGDRRREVGPMLGHLAVGRVDGQRVVAHADVLQAALGMRRPEHVPDRGGEQLGHLELHARIGRGEVALWVEHQRERAHPHHRVRRRGVAALAELEEGHDDLLHRPLHRVRRHAHDDLGEDLDELSRVRQLAQRRHSRRTHQPADRRLGQRVDQLHADAARLAPAREEYRLQVG